MAGKSTKSKFKPVTEGRRNISGWNKKDAVGRVRISIALALPGGRGASTVPGNIHKSILVDDARVSDVHKFLEDVMFSPESD